MKATETGLDRQRRIILVVDDDQTNVALLRDFLEPEEYHVVGASGGAEALEKAVRTPPDLVLLDILMPGMSGFEVCRKLKEHPRTRLIPVVFITALNDTGAKIAGLEAGGDDFLSKPLDDVELLVRCRNLLRIKRLTDDLQASYVSLQAMDKLQTDLRDMIVHDIRNALTPVMSSISLALQELVVPESLRELFRVSLVNCQKLLSMTQDLLDLSRMESSQLSLTPRRVDVGDMLIAHKDLFIDQLQRKQIRCEVANAQQPVVAEADPYLVARVLSNLLGNAVRYCQPGGRIVLSATVHPESGLIQVSVFNDGEPIAAEHHAIVFEKFKRLPRAEGEGGLGLGLAFCKLAVEAHGGRIWIESPAAGAMGVIFHFTLRPYPSDIIRSLERPLSR